eukprot:scaffold21_cov368-Prasinococcus_capsulatus_cf.AAC.26
MPKGERLLASLALYEPCCRSLCCCARLAASRNPEQVFVRVRAAGPLRVLVVPGVALATAPLPRSPAVAIRLLPLLLLIGGGAIPPGRVPSATCRVVAGPLGRIGQHFEGLRHLLEPSLGLLGAPIPVGMPLESFLPKRRFQLGLRGPLGDPQHFVEAALRPTAAAARSVRSREDARAIHGSVREAAQRLRQTLRALQPRASFVAEAARLQGPSPSSHRPARQQRRLR